MCDEEENNKKIFNSLDRALKQFQTALEAFLILHNQLP
jgi:hypothetical protein